MLTFADKTEDPNLDAHAEAIQLSDFYELSYRETKSDADKVKFLYWSRERARLLRLRMDKVVAKYLEGRSS